MGARITIVGGGSTRWVPPLLVDFVNHQALADADVVLMDIDDRALGATLKLGHHLAGRRGAAMQVRATTDLDEALDGSQFVVVALSVGGFASMRHDLEIPARYGIRQPIGDSVGPGGIANALRSIPAVLGVARAMERRCPKALLVNVSNPLTALCRAVARETSIRVVGLCNEVLGLQFTMSLLFDAGLDDVDPVIAGVNHLPIATSLRIGDRDGFAMLRHALEGRLDLSGPLWIDPPEMTEWEPSEPGRGWTKADVLENHKVKFELFRRFGVLPASSDVHVVEFVPGFLTDASDFGRDWGIRRRYGLDGHRAAKAKDNANLEWLLSSDEVPQWPSGDLVAPLLEGLVAGPDRPLPMNLPNDGQVQNLPPGAVVECIGVAGSAGMRPRDTTTVPGILGEHLRRVAFSQELTVDAAIAGDRTKVLEAMLGDPMAGRLPYEHVLAMTGELLTATAPWLPQFAG